MNVSRTLIIAALLVTLALLPGCMTNEVIRHVEHGKPRFDCYAKGVSDARDMIPGRSCGDTTNNGTKYRRFVFNRAVPWPNASRLTSLEVLLPLELRAEPLLSAVGEAFPPPNREVDSLLFIRTSHDCALTAVQERAVSYWQHHLSPSTRSAAKPVATDHGTIICLFVTKAGVGSEIMAGRPDGQGFVWQGPYTCMSKPPAYTGKWWSAWDRLGYAAMVLSVPLDVITLPVQIPVAIFMCWVGAGMSPT